MRLLVSLGIGVDTRARGGTTALHLAARNGNTEHVRMLVQELGGRLPACDLRLHDISISHDFYSPPSVRWRLFPRRRSRQALAPSPCCCCLCCRFTCRTGGGGAQGRTGTRQGRTAQRRSWWRLNTNAWG